MKDNPKINLPRTLQILLPFEVSNLFTFAKVPANWDRSKEINCYIDFFQLKEMERLC